MERMNTAAPVSERDDGYTQDLASQWVAAALQAQAAKRVAIRFQAKRIATWDHRKLGGTY